MYRVFLLIVITFLFSSLQPSYGANTSAFSRLPAYQKVRLSPTGKQLSFIENDVDHQASILRIFDLKTGQFRSLLNSDNKRVKIKWHRWKTDEMLMVSVQYESKLENGQRYHQSRLYSVNTKAKEIKKVEMFRTSNAEYSPQFRDRIVDWLYEDPKHILMEADLDFQGRPDVYKVKIKNGIQRRVVREQRKIRDWMADRQSQVRIGYARNYDTNDIVYWYRDNQDEQFKRLFEYNLLTDKPINVLGFDADPMTLYYTKYDGDYRALYKMNMKTRESVLLLKHDKYDVGNALLISTKRNDVIGIADKHSPHGRYYFNEEDYKFHEALNSALPDEYNSISSQTWDQSKYVVYSHSDNSPPFFYLGNREDNELMGLFASYPELENVALPKHKKIKYKARDGLEIEAYLTLPMKGEAPYPTVIHPHGGPGSSDGRGFDPWVSYLVYKGYAVIRPNFRGSTGFGYEFAQAQMGRWGLEMQDDITDAAHYLMEKGISREDKLCIFGGSYGGYAALMATVKTPDLFACAISFAGVSDLKKLKRQESRWIGGDSIAEAQIGKKRADLKARSPLFGVGKVRTPLLIMHGSDDITVPVDHSRRMSNKLRSLSKDHKYVEFERGDHYLSIQANRHQFFEEIDTFLTKHLGETGSE